MAFHVMTSFRGEIAKAAAVHSRYARAVHSRFVPKHVLFSNEHTVGKFGHNTKGNWGLCQVYPLCDVGVVIPLRPFQFPFAYGRKEGHVLAFTLSLHACLEISTTEGPKRKQANSMKPNFIQILNWKRRHGRRFINFTEKCRTCKFLQARPFFLTGWRPSYWHVYLRRKWWR